MFSPKMVSSFAIFSLAVVMMSGCAKSVQCKMPDNSTVRISILEDAPNTTIIRDRWNPIMEAVYNENTRISNNVVTAERSEVSKLHPNTPFMPLKVELDGNKKIVQLGEDTYTCQDDLLELVKLVQKIEQEKIDKRIRSVSSN